MVGFVFQETTDAASEITRLFDFTWPTAVALWNLRWQVDGFLKAVPDATYADVASRFVVGSDIHGADIRSMSINSKWDEQKSRFAEFILTNIFSIYEGWCEQLFSRSPVKGMTSRDLYREGDGKTTGLNAFILKINLSVSSVARDTFQAAFLTHKKADKDKLTNYLKCYKYFKEVRNCQIHKNGLADARALEAFEDFSTVSSDLGTKGEIEFYSVTIGQKTPLSLRGVVGFCDIVLRMMVTIDALMSGSKTAEQSIIDRLKSATSGPRITLSSNDNKSLQKVKGICRTANLPAPSDVEAVRQLLIEQRLVFCAEHLR